METSERISQVKQEQNNTQSQKKYIVHTMEMLLKVQRLLKEYIYSFNYNNADGNNNWGVVLTNKTSTDPVTEAPYIYIY